MAKAFRLACAIDSYIGAIARPPLPAWLKRGIVKPGRVAKRAHEYWMSIYFATPPWISKAHIEKMRDTYLKCPAGYEVDHIVPLNSPIVCGLHVPWNLQHLKSGPNGLKSNHMWPGHPCQPLELRLPEFEPYQMRLL